MDSEDKRYAECAVCRHRWNISVSAKIPKSGYICPMCEVLLRKYPMRVVKNRMRNKRKPTERR